jgi:hypothetical protein
VSGARRITLRRGLECRAHAGAFAILVVLSGFLGGCATMPAQLTPAGPGQATAAPAPPTPAAAAAPIGTPPPAAAPADSGPSSDALRVLATIPDPLGVPAPEGPRGDAASSGAQGVPGDGAGDVPVPAPTVPLGQGSAAAIPVVIPPAAAMPPPPPKAVPGLADADSCWRVQIGASAERSKAEGSAAAASSLLLLPAQVEPDAGLYKIRLRDCYSKAVADSVRRRAVANGFTDAFRFSQPMRHDRAPSGSGTQQR